MTGNIIVSTCCLGDMARVLGLCPRTRSGAFTAISPSQTCANYYLIDLVTCKNWTTLTKKIGVMKYMYWDTLKIETLEIFV